MFLPEALIVLALVFWAWCVVDYTRTDPRQMRTLDPMVWLVLLVIGSVAGGVCWVIGGRPRHPAR
jgi:hypothetical protein